MLTTFIQTESMYFMKKYYFLPFDRLIQRYARGAATKIEDTVPAKIPTPIIYENVLIRPVPKTRIIMIMIRAASEVPKDLLIVCQRLSSNICRYVILPVLIAHSCMCIFSLTLSKIIIVSLMLYPMTVKIDAMKTKSTCVAGFKTVSSPYAPEGIEMSNSNVTTVISARIAGDTMLLTAENANII
jgi:hypothetical protein